jgi:uncharacterized membrane protein YidH (DUF202 family)
MKHWKRVLALLLIAGGIFVLVEGGFTYTKDRRSLDLGFLEFTAKDRERVAVPPWAGMAAIVVGTLILLKGRR